MRNSFITALAAGVLFAGVATADSLAAAPERNAFSFDVRGFVPVICRATVAASTVSSNTSEVPLGQLNQFCNDPNGYQVWVDYSPELANGALLVDGQAISLSGQGSTMIRSSNQPSIEAHDLALDLPANGIQGSLSIRVVAL